MLPIHIEKPMLFLRHVQSVRNALEVSGKTQDEIKAILEKQHTSVSPISEVGQQQIAEIEAWLPAYCRQQGWSKVAVLYSPFTRTTSTAKGAIAVLTEAGLLSFTDENTLLVEHSVGAYGKGHQVPDASWQAYRDQANEDDAFHFVGLPGGDSHLNTTVRMQLFYMELIAAEMKGLFKDIDAIIVVGHGASGRLLFRLLLGHPWGWFHDVPTNSLPNGAARLIVGKTDHGIVFKPTIATS